MFYAVHVRSIFRNADKYHEVVVKDTLDFRVKVHYWLFEDGWHMHNGFREQARVFHQFLREGDENEPAVLALLVDLEKKIGKDHYQAALLQLIAVHV